MLNRAYSLLDIKSIDEDARIIEGIATTPSTDRQGDIVEPKGAEFTLPIPFLWQHDSKRPVGAITYAKVTPGGIHVKAQFATIAEPGRLKDRLDEAWQSVKLKLVRGLSIGFSPIEAEPIKGSFGMRFLKWNWLELSAVTIPANQDANILTVKHFDIGFAASGTKADIEPARPITQTGAPVTTRVAAPSPPQGRSMKTTAEKIVSFKAEKDAKLAKMNGLTPEDGSTMDAAQQEEFDTLVTEIKSIDSHMARLETLDQMNKAAAKPVVGDTEKHGTESRTSLPVITVKSAAPPGIGMARLAMCVAVSKGNVMQAYEIAKTQYPDEQGIQMYLKAAVAAGTTANAQGPLLQYTDFMGDFVDYLRPQTIIGKFGTNGIPSLRRMPFNVRVSTQTAGASGYWVGQGKPTPLSKGTFGTTTLDFHKVGSISVLTKEEVRFANPSAEAKVRDDLAAALIARTDIDFVDPSNAGTASVKPASITNGVAATAVSGADADAVRVDFKNLMAGFISNNITPSAGVLIMSAQIALNLSLMLNALGQREFPDLQMSGGRLFGLPVIVSEYLTALGSPSTGMVILVNASDVYLADDGNVSVEASDQASVEMLDSSLIQDGAAGTGTSLVSLWQSGLLGLKAEREITWKMRRAAAVQYLSPVAYTPTT